MQASARVFFNLFISYFQPLADPYLRHAFLTRVMGDLFNFKLLMVKVKNIPPLIDQQLKVYMDNNLKDICIY